MFAEFFDRVREKSPLIHNITNYVTVNDCANVLLAAGASPIMSDDAGEVEEITGICNGLNINIGTLNERTIRSMILAGERANVLGNPVVLDPVGAGASRLRTKTAKKLLNRVDFTVIRGNMSEIKAMFSEESSTKGVDASDLDKVTEDNLEEAISFAKGLAKKTGAILAISGAIDLICDPTRALIIRNGTDLMPKITGTGCQLSALTAAFLAANPGKAWEATGAAFVAMGYGGEVARERMTDLDGNSSYRNYIIDAICNMEGKDLDKGAKYEIR